jgi:hypothetical protein
MWYAHKGRTTREAFRESSCWAAGTAAEKAGVCDKGRIYHVMCHFS